MFQTSASCSGFLCHDGECVGNNSRCNNINDCDDGSDEHNCGKFSLELHNLKYISNQIHCI